MTEQEKMIKKFQKEINAGTTSLALLAIMDRATEPMYGYQIAKLLESKEESSMEIKQGALYPVLRSMEKGALLSSQVEPSVSGPPRKYYAITNYGKEIFVEWLNIWENTRKFIDNIIEGEKDE